VLALLTSISAPTIAQTSISAGSVQEGKQQLSGRCFAWVQTYDEKPKRRLFELLQSQGMLPNQQVNFLSDGGEDVRNVQLYLNPQAEHLLDWFHLTMRLTVLNQTAKGLPERIGEGEDQCELRPGVLKDLERIKWYLWHGNVFQALNELQSLEMDLDAAAFESKDENARKLLKSVEDVHTYVERNREFVPNYGERYRNVRLEVQSWSCLAVAYGSGMAPFQENRSRFHSCSQSSSTCSNALIKEPQLLSADSRLGRFESLRKTCQVSFTSMTSALTATCAGKPHPLISRAATTAATPMCLI
jgi:hypothetical protein